MVYGHIGIQFGILRCFFNKLSRMYKKQQTTIILVYQICMYNFFYLPIRHFIYNLFNTISTMIVHLIRHDYLQQEVAFMGKHSAAVPPDFIFYNNIKCNTCLLPYNI